MMGAFEEEVMRAFEEEAIATAAMKHALSREETLVTELGSRIGYGRVMQLCEIIWNRMVPGGALSVGPCMSQLVICPHFEKDINGHCNWCCGSGRVTERVLQAQNEDYDRRNGVKP